MTTQLLGSALNSSIGSIPQQSSEIRKIRRYAVIGAVLWTLLLSGSLAAYYADNLQTIHEIGHSMAQASFEKDLLYRRWAARHGGVYVPETAASPANPYLSHIPDRDIITPSGKRLTLVNPAYMTRQVFELAEENINIPHGHITSLNPIRSENAPDPWEARALKSLEQGAKEVVEQIQLNGQPHLRFMRPLMTEKPCLRCHATQGYKEGDSRGGISVTLSLAPIYKAMNKEMLQEALLHSFIWLLGLGFIWLGTRKITRITKSLRDEHDSLLESEARFRSLTDTAPVLIWMSDETKGCTYFNKRWCDFSGREQADLLGDRWAQDVHPDDLEKCIRIYENSFDTRKEFSVEYRLRRRDGEYRWLLDNGVPRWTDEKKFVGYIGSCIDITESKLAEEKLRNNEALLNSTQRLAKVGGWELDIESQSVAWTEETYRIYDLEPGTVMSVSPENIERSLNCYNQKDRQVIMDAFRRCSEHGDEYDLMLPFTTATGRKLWIRTTAQALRDGNRIVKVVGNIMDITEQKQAEEALKESGERYRSLYKNTPAMLHSIDANGYLISVSEYWLSTLGYTRDEVIGQKSTEFLSEASRKYAIETVLPEFMKTGHCHDIEYQYVKKNGEVIDSLLSAISERDENGILLRSLAVVTDITERKLLENDLRDSKEQYKTIVDAFDGQIYICSQEYRILFMNNKSIERTGRSAVGELCFNALHDMDGICPWCVNERVFNGETVHWEVQSPKDGRWYYVVNTPIHNVDGTISKQAMIQDITDRKQDEQDRLKLESKLHQAQKMESIGSLAGGVAHDFNNKLAVILGYTSLASAEPDPATLQNYLELIRKAGEQSADLTRQLLAFARKQTIAPKVLDLNETVSGMLKMLSRLIGENITLTWQPATDLWRIKVDPSQIDQILANLCVNARDSIDGVGNITIETGNGKLDKKYCDRNPGALPGQYVRLAVSDNGSGMSKETMTHIFEPFFTTKEVGKGTGLGLSTIFGIVKQNNGFINVNSEPGSGTTFSIYLPRHSGKDNQAPKEGMAMLAPRGLEIILLVEDDVAILDMAAMILSKQGYTVLTANSATEATRLAKENSGEISLLITDVIMPEMNGKDLTQKLQSLCPQLKSLFMSGYTSDAIVQHGVLEEGVNFIQKPFTLPDLATKVREVLDS